jgi:mRNA-degrading endonuclease toxin of MazEF toxin-antitoxin module
MYQRGDVVIASPRSNEGKPRLAIIIQADWFNLGDPPSYIVCLLSSDVYKELDFRPIIEPDNNNGLSITSQVMTDKVQVVKSGQIGKKIGSLNKKQLAVIDGYLRALMGL